MRDEQIINSREMILKVFSNIDKKRFEEKDSVENAWKKITTSIKNGSKEDIGAKLFSHSSLVDVKDGILLIETDHPGFIQLFRIHEMYILRGLKKIVPQLEIRCLSFRLRGSKAVLSEIENEIKIYEKQKMENKFNCEEKTIEKIYKNEQKTEKNCRIPENMKEAFERMRKSMLTKSCQ